MLKFSVIIRTTGKAGEKYRRLLTSIANLNPQPEEVIVVLPVGYELPSDQLGYEKFYFCKKGMVIQRLYGIEKCMSPYALITDDDIAFDSNFVNKLSKPVVSGKYGISAGPLIEFFPNPGIQTFVSSIIGSAIPTVFNRKRYNTVLKTTGYSFNRQIQIGSGKLYETQSAPWTCFFADVQKLRSIKFADELWLDECGYSAHDDTAMFYKAWLMGVKSVIVSDAIYEHLDAKTSSKGNGYTVLYALGFNSVVFWYRFLSGDHILEKMWSKFCINYYLFMQKVLNQINYKRGKVTADERDAFSKGTRAGWKWIKDGKCDLFLRGE